MAYRKSNVPVDKDGIRIEVGDKVTYVMETIGVDAEVTSVSDGVVEAISLTLAPEFKGKTFKGPGTDFLIYEKKAL